MKLAKDDLRFVVTRIPRDVRKLMEEHGVMLGGGFIRETIANQKPNDVDIFGASKGVLATAAKYIREKRDGRLFTTDNAVTVLCANRMPVHFITRWLFGDATSLVASFDFTVCQAAIWFDRDEQLWKSEVSDRFYIDLAARRLVYTAPAREEEAGGSMMRVRKFLARGYSIQSGSLGAVIARIAMQVDMDKLRHDAKSRGEAVEDLMGRVIGGLLREVDPNIVLDGLEPVDEHETINNNRVKSEAVHGT